MEKKQIELDANATITFYSKTKKVYEVVMPYKAIKGLDYFTFQLESFEGNSSIDQPYLNEEVCKWYCDHLLWRVSDPKDEIAEPKNPHPFVGLLAHFLADDLFYDRLEISEIKFKFVCKRGSGLKFQYGYRAGGCRELGWGPEILIDWTPKKDPRYNLIKFNHLQDLLRETDPNKFKDIEARSGIKWIDPFKAERFCACKDCRLWSTDDSYRAPEEKIDHVGHRRYRSDDEGMLPLENRFGSDYKLRNVPLDFMFLLEETVEITVPGGVYATSLDFYSVLYKCLEKEKIQLQGRKGNKILYHPDRPLYSGYRLEPTSLQKKQPDFRRGYLKHDFGERHDYGDFMLRDHEDQLEVVINPLRRRQYDIKKIGEAEMAILADNEGPILNRIVSSYIETHTRSGKTYTRVLNFANNNQFLAKYAWDSRREELIERFALMKSFLKCDFNQLTKRVTGVISMHG